MLVDDGLQVGIQLVAVSQQVVQIGLTQDVPQGSLTDLHGGIDIIDDVGDCALRIDDIEVEDGGHANGDVIPRNNLLRWHLHGDDTQIYFDNASDEWWYKHWSWPLRTL